MRGQKLCFKPLLTGRAEKFSDGTDSVACFSLPRLEMQPTSIHWTRPASSVGTDKFRTTCIWFDPLPVTTPSRKGLESDDLLQVGCLGLIKAYNRYEAKRGAPFPSFAKPHIRGAILHFLRDRAGLVRLPRAVEERAMKMMRNPEGTPLSAADALAVDHYRSKQHWVEFNDDLLDDRPEGIDLIERSEAWSRVNKLFRNLEKDDQRALQMVVLDGMSLRQTDQQLEVSAMTVQRRVKRGLNTLANELKAAQLGALASRSI